MKKFVSRVKNEAVQQIPAAQKEIREQAARYLKVLPYLAVMACMASLLLGMSAFAAPDTKSAFTFIFKVMGFSCAVLGVFFFVQGLINYILANNNENGPDMDKALKRIVSGIILVVFGGALVAGNGMFADLIPDNFQM